MLQKIVILGIIIFIKAIFSAGDTAFTYLNKAKISQESKKNKKAKKINTLLNNNTKFYGVIEVGITMTELIASAYAGEAFVKQLATILQQVYIPETIAIGVSIVIITLILSYFLLVFGAVLPKRIARNHPEQTAYRLINIIWAASKINYPFEKIIHGSTHFFAVLFGIKENEKQKLTEKEIKMMILEGKEQGVVNKIEKDIVFNALKFNDILVKNIMIPKEKIDFINIDDSTDTILANIVSNPYTRMPVYKENTDNILGVFNMKDIALEYAKNKNIDLDMNKFLRPVTFVDKEEKIATVFRNMQLNNIAMVIAVDTNKKVVGLLTSEDIIERLVGKIFDEYDNINQNNSQLLDRREKHD